MKRRFLLSLFFIIIGTVIYIMYYINVFEKNNILFSTIKNYLPDICWTLSFYFMSINFTIHLTKKYILINSLYVLSISLLYEALQLFNIVNGTFDIFDISAYILSIIIASLLESKIRRKENEKI